MSSQVSRRRSRRKPDVFAILGGVTRYTSQRIPGSQSSHGVCEPFVDQGQSEEHTLNHDDLIREEVLAGFIEKPRCGDELLLEAFFHETVPPQVQLSLNNRPRMNRYPCLKINVVRFHRPPDCQERARLQIQRNSFIEKLQQVFSSFSQLFTFASNELKKSLLCYSGGFFQGLPLH